MDISRSTAFHASQTLSLRTLRFPKLSSKRQCFRSPVYRRPIKTCSTPTPDLDVPDDPADVPDTDQIELKRLHSLPIPPSIPRPPEPTVVEVEFSPGKILRLETGRMARQAGGAVVVRRGDTVLLCTACYDSECSPSIDFLPLRVDYAEKFSALGKTSGSYIKREGRPSEREILISRLIDRPLRPMFKTGYYNDTQLLATLFSYDPTNPPDAAAIAGASAALYITDIPLMQSVSGVRVGCFDGKFVVEPTVEEMEHSTCDLIIAGTKENILMIEGAAQFLSEEQVLEAVKVAHEAIKKQCDAIEELREKMATERVPFTDTRVPSKETLKQMEGLADGIDEALAVIGKKEREKMVKSVKERVFSVMKPTREDELNDPDEAIKQNTLLRIAWKKVISDHMRYSILRHNVRPDGRDSETVRPITIDQSPLPSSHGSSLFTRGETQSLAVCTLGGDEMAQRYETLDGEGAARFYLQYSFPPFSVGEVGRIGAPGRREIGHGKLAERSLVPALPESTEFPYVIRIESNILESNGSSSMASVCGGCLAMLDAGVPLSSSVAGVAMGLVVDENEEDMDVRDKNAVVLTDILGLEDALGCCDAKFAGNREGLSALQLDVKLQGISISLFERLIIQAKKARMHVLDCMDAVQAKPSADVAATVPKVLSIKIPPKSIGDVIGQGGKTIRSIIEKCGGENMLKISIGNDGQVSFTSTDDELISRAIAMVRVFSKQIEVGTIVRGKVTKVLPFGAYIEVAEGKEGWLHISELENKRTEKVTDVCTVGMELEVKITEVGRNGQFRVSRKALLQKSSKSNGVTEDGATVGKSKIPKQTQKPARSQLENKVNSDRMDESGYVEARTTEHGSQESAETKL